MGRLEGKTAIITGAGRGIGRATAELFLAEGANLVLADRDNLDSLKQLSGEVKAKTLVIKADLSNLADITSLVREAFSAFSRIEILVNNAGIFEVSDFENISEKQFTQMLDVNLKSVFFLTQEVLKLFKKQNYGRVINVSSGAGKNGSSSSAHYAVTKAGLIALTKSLARAYGRFNINVNAVAPSLIDTGMLQQIPQERLGKLIEAIPLKRLGKPEEVARLILFLASNNADYITGQTISIDGGLLMI